MTENSWLLAAAEKNLPMFVPGGRLDAGQYVCGALHLGRCEESSHGTHRHRVHDGAGRVVHQYHGEDAAGIFQMRAGSRRFSDLRGADAAPGSAARPCAAVGFISARFGLDDELRIVLGRGAEREDHVGKLGENTPKFIIESDASIVAPLIFAYVLGGEEQGLGNRIRNRDQGIERTVKVRAFHPSEARMGTIFLMIDTFARTRVSYRASPQTAGD